MSSELCPNHYKSLTNCSTHFSLANSNAKQDFAKLSPAPAKAQLGAEVVILSAEPATHPATHPTTHPYEFQRGKIELYFQNKSC